EALRFSEQARKRDPNNAPVCYEMSRVLSAIAGPENTRRAVDLAQLAAQLDPRDADHWQQLGLALRSLGRDEEAEDAFLRALDIDPVAETCQQLVQTEARRGHAGTAQFWSGLVSELEARGRLAKRLWRAVHQRPMDGVGHDHLARFLLATGDLRRAGY